MEQENIELHERLTVGDKDFQMYRMMKEDELAKFVVLLFFSEFDPLSN